MAVNLGRERPTPAHVNQADAGTYPVSPYGLTVKTSPAVVEFPKKKTAASAKSRFNHR